MLKTAQLPAKMIGAKTTKILQSIAKPPKLSDLIGRHNFLIITSYHIGNLAHNAVQLLKSQQFALTCMGQGELIILLGMVDEIGRFRI